jgi:maltooligosyltrehalose trehalohydrolase
LPTIAFVDFLQNHDQVGNRAFGERLASLASDEAIEAVTALLLLSPHIPLLFMGEEWGSQTPFNFFCDFHGDLAASVRDGRRREFARFPGFRDPAARDRIPDPNAPATFSASRLDWRELGDGSATRRLERARALLALRAREIAPRLGGCTGETATCDVRERRAFRVTWRLDDGVDLSVTANLSDRPIAGLDWPIHGRVLAAQPVGLSVDSHMSGLPAWSVVWTLVSPGGHP